VHSRPRGEPLTDGGGSELISGPAGVVLMGGLWLDVLGFVAVFVVVFVLVAACERDRH
jgi:hypothetical protein